MNYLRDAEIYILNEMWNLKIINVGKVKLENYSNKNTKVTEDQKNEEIEKLVWSQSVEELEN